MHVTGGLGTRSAGPGVAAEQSDVQSSTNGHCAAPGARAGHSGTPSLRWADSRGLLPLTAGSDRPATREEVPDSLEAEVITWRQST